jgi:hypothetical protein
MSRPRQPQKPFWRWARRVFRWCRIAVLLVVLAVVVAAIWLNRVGLPDFLKDRLVLELRERGIALRFSRMRLHWYRGLVAENIHLGQPASTNAPRVSATEAELLLDGRALLRREIQLKGFGLRGGRLTVPVWGTNAAPREFVVEKITGELRFAPPDEWELTGFHAETFGVKFLLAGTVTNASSIRRLVKPREGPARPRSVEAFWYDLVAKLEQSEFEKPSEIVGRIEGDANEASSFRATLDVSSPRVKSPWGSGRQVKAAIQLAPSRSGPFEADVRIHAQDAVTEWGRAGLLTLEAHVAPSFTRWTPTNAHLSLAVTNARTPWGGARELTLLADFTPSQSDSNASLAHYTLRARQVESKWAKTARLELVSDAVLNSSNLWPSTATTALKFAGGEIEWGRAAAGSVEGTLELPPLDVMRFGDTNVSWWSRLDRVLAGLRVSVDAVRTPRLDAEKLSFAADWRPPVLALQNLHGELLGGVFYGGAGLNTESRALNAAARTTIDPRRVAPLLHTNAQKWLAQFAWEKAPHINASARVTLPVWTNGGAAFASADWEGAVLPTLVVEGDFAAGRASWRGVTVDAAKSSFTVSNQVLRLPDLEITRPEGRVTAGYFEDGRRHEFALEFASAVDLRALGPLLPADARAVLEEFDFKQPPVLRGGVSGNWRRAESIAFRTTFAGTNFSYRGLPVLSARALVTMTNQLISAIEPEVVRTEGTGRADAVRVDVKRNRVHLENATGSLDAWAVTHAIGKQVEDTMQPYKFLKPPTGRVWGVIQADDTRGTELHFEVTGGPFEWSGFKFQQITGSVHWLGETLILTNVHGAFHGGHLQGWTHFDFAKPRGGQMKFRTEFSGVNLNSLVTDFGNKTNRAEGVLDGLLVIDDAALEDFKSWRGYGWMTLKDGLIWDFPIFGLFSPMLNAIKEGSGNNKAKEAAATFTITNSVIHSTDLIIQASGMRLNYDGTVDFDARVNGRMEAQLFRNTPGVGTVLSTVFWPVTKILEYKITGTLGKPEAAPLFIPKLLLMPFHPLRTLKELGGEKE